MEPAQCACRSSMASASTTPGCSSAAGGSCPGPPADVQCVRRRAGLHSAVCVEQPSHFRATAAARRNCHAVQHGACAEHAPYSYSRACVFCPAGVGHVHQLQGVFCCAVLATTQRISTCTYTSGSSMNTAAGRRCQGQILWRVGFACCRSAHTDALRHFSTDCLCVVQGTSCAYPASAETATAPILAVQL